VLSIGKRRGVLRPDRRDPLLDEVAERIPL